MPWSTAFRKRWTSGSRSSWRMRRSTSRRPPSMTRSTSFPVARAASRTTRGICENSDEIGCRRVSAAMSCSSETITESFFDAPTSSPSCRFAASAVMRFRVTSISSARRPSRSRTCTGTRTVELASSASPARSSSPRCSASVAGSLPTAPAAAGSAGLPLVAAGRCIALAAACWRRSVRSGSPSGGSAWPARWAR
ncbi:hypothetical protein HRbin27_00125 [bacterium HR27]|nr:hypothetical protein HRbin27_00125 [bacterium HR27]